MCMVRVTKRLKDGQDRKRQYAGRLLLCDESTTAYTTIITMNVIAGMRGYHLLDLSGYVPM